MREKEIHERVQGLLEEALSGPGFRLLEVRMVQRPSGATADLAIRLESPGPGHPKGVLLLDVKGRGEPSFLAQAIMRLRTIDQGRVRKDRSLGPSGFIGLAVVAPFISERGRRLCRDNGVGYMDLAGNCYLLLGASIVDRTGRENPRHERRVARRLFAPKASLLAMALLEEPGRPWRLSELAAVTGLSLGHVHAVVKRLEADRFLRRSDGRLIILERPAELLDAWALAYTTASVETHSLYTLQRNVSAVIKRLVEAATDLKAEYALTMHAGASLIAPFTRFNETHLYTHKEDVERWTKALDLRPTDAGANVHLLVPRDDGVFYRKQTIRGASVVCNTRLYLDLYKYPGRGREQAEFLRKEKLRF